MGEFNTRAAEDLAKCDW